MIVKLDHLSFCGASFREEVARFASLGYTVSFFDYGIPNPGIKRALMRHFPAKHSIALLTCPGGANVELIEHGPLSGQDGYLIPVFGQSASISGARIKTRDRERTVLFWSLLGFRRCSGLDGRETLEFQSPFAGGGLSLHLEEDAGPKKINYLDDRGFNCVALFSSALRREKERLEREGGFYTTGLETVRVNHRALIVCFAKGPSGELVELIGLPEQEKEERHGPGL